ncbi:TPA: acetate/propionate family kinase, partial [bacterium]|nr:acetate/propionate family kinase [bacterium]
MSKILAVNAGSSSLKFQLFEGDREEVITSGVIERIGMEDAIFTIKYDGEKNKRVLPIKDHSVAVNLLLESLIEFKIVESINEISGVGHRVVHGGELFNSSIVVTNEVVENLKKINDLAPLHNPANIGGYEAFKEVLPGVGHVFVFDTAFHSTMEKEEFLYPLPYEYYEKYGVRRYGAHGTSHYYVSNEYITRNNLEKSKIITCHIGNGASITAIKDGKCIATSMGFTPLSGVMMGTRCGDVDPAIVTYIMEKKGLTAEEVLNEFNKKSGLLGVSELSNDSREIED